MPKIVLDANQIQQVIINLLVNAIDAIGKENGKIVISTKEIKLSPFGVAQIRNAVCPNNHSLMDSEHKIDGLPSIKVKAKINGNEGYVHLDPVYGRMKNYFGINVPKDKPVELYCPECDASLMDKTKKCPECTASVYHITIPQMGVLEGCAKNGATYQKWEYIDKMGEQKFVEIKVADTGCGISQENLSKIFEPFFSTKGQKGTGLGLSVIWGIIDNHNGNINVDSEPGKGTTFTIKLPEREEEFPATA